MSIDKKLIVIIDDDVDDCYFTQFVIHKNFTEYEVVTITDSCRAVDRLAALHAIPHLILLDLLMPVSGVEVLTQLRKLASYDSVPVAVLSSLSDPGVLDRVRTLGVVYLGEKPSNMEDLSVLLIRLLG